MEQIRVIKEMRDADVRRGRAGQFIRPRYCIWENVPGALSSNGGRDFQAVLAEFIRIADPDAPAVPLPDKGKWQKWGGYMGTGPHGRWSVAYRIHDAQHWGVPQRRKRVCVLADYGGWTAHRILFDPEYRGEAEVSDSDKAVADIGGQPEPEVQPECEGVSGYFEPSEPQGEETAGGAGEGADNSVARGGVRVSYPDVANSLTRRYDGSPQPDKQNGANIVVTAGFSMGQSEKARSIGYQQEVSPTLRGGEGGNQKPCVLACNVYNQEMTGEVAGTVTAACGGSNTSGPKVLCGNPWDSQSERVFYGDGAWHSLSANENGGQNRDAVMVENADGERDNQSDI